MSTTIPWWQPEVGPAEYELVRSVLESHFLNDGELTTRFEDEIAKLVGAHHAVAVTSGTAAITLALMGLGIGAGDEVIVPDVTFIATANAVTLAGAKPVLADVDEATLCLSPDALRRAITRRTRAVVPVHVSGRGGTLDAVLAVAREHGLLVVEDAAEALGSRYRGRYLGLHGQAGCFSFSPNKTIMTGQGGMIVTNDARLHARLRELKDQGRPVRGTGGDDAHPTLGFNFKFTNLQAAVGLGQLHYYADRVARQQAIYRCYRDELREVAQLRLFPFAVDDGEIPQWTDVAAEARDGLDRHLAQHGCGCRRLWHPLHTQPPYRGQDADFPVATRVGPRCLWLPSAFQLTDAQVRHVAGLVRMFYHERTR
jgi:perosamine synthetase